MHKIMLCVICRGVVVRVVVVFGGVKYRNWEEV